MITAHASRQGTGRVCVFCGGSPVTKEHVLPTWLEPYLRTGADIEWITLDDARNLVSRRTTPNVCAMEVKRVCAPCNNGWMSALENRAKPLLEPILLGKQCLLDPPDAEVIARWCAKTLFMARFVVPEGHRYAEIPDEHYQWLPTHQGPHPEMHLFIGAYAGSRQATFFLRRVGLRATAGQVDNRRPPKEITGYLATIVVGYLVVQGFGTELGLFLPGSRAELTPRFAAHASPLWPNRGDIVSWPPPVGFDDAALELFGEGPTAI